MQHVSAEQDRPADRRLAHARTLLPLPRNQDPTFRSDAVREPARAPSSSATRSQPDMHSPLISRQLLDPIHVDTEFMKENPCPHR